MKVMGRYGQLSLNNRFGSHIALTAAAVLALFLTGCGGEGSLTPETTAVAADVQGSSFDAPASPVPESASATPVTTSQTPATVTQALPSAAQTQSAPAAASFGTPAPVLDLKPSGAAPISGIPDIASIPSATPAPSPTPSSSAAKSASPQAAAPSGAVGIGDYNALSFVELAGFKYEEPIPKSGEKPEEVEARRPKNQIPETVMALNGKMAAVEGWMVPMQVDDDGGVKSFVLVKTQPACCFGDTQKMNEWIDVTMKGDVKAEFNVDRPITVYGKLEVGEKVEDGFVLSIYRMAADLVKG
jgi:hypothetical protein